MKSIIMKSLIYFGIVICLLSCNDDNLTDNNNASENVIFPLNTNNKWKIRISNADSINQFGFATNYIIKDTLIENATWFKSEIHYLFGVDYKFIRNSKDGLLVYDTYLNKSSVMLRYPAKKNEIYGYFGEEIKVVSTNDTISVPAGKYVCYHYEMSLLDVWYCPNIGLVRQEEFVGFKNTSLRRLVGISELMSLELK